VMGLEEKGALKARLSIAKFKGDFKSEAEAKEKGVEPYEVDEETFEMPLEDVFLNEGINAIWTLVCGGTETAFNNANARVGVGNSNAAESPTHTGLQGTSTAFAAMESGYPTFGSGQKATFKGTFASGQGEFAWEEFTVDNGATPNKNLHRKVTSKGTKPSGETWILTIELSLS